MEEPPITSACDKAVLDFGSMTSLELVGASHEFSSRAVLGTDEPSNMAGGEMQAINLGAPSYELGIHGIDQCLHSKVPDCISTRTCVLQEEDCVGCGMKRYHSPRFWTCEVCGGYLLCDNCFIAQSSCKGQPSPHIGKHHMGSNLLSYTCDCCGSCPVLNRRWACQACLDLDLCETCYKEVPSAQMPLGHSQKHTMLEIEVIPLSWIKTNQLESRFSKPKDPQWSYRLYDSESSGYEWIRKDFVTNLYKSQRETLGAEQVLQNLNVSSKEEVQNDMNKTYRPLDPKCKIFLSHAGPQKRFVEHLDSNLRKVHHFGIFFDKDDDSLPKGEPFPDLIFEAAKQCELAIVVMSHDYFTRKWPMLELLTFVEAQRTRPSLKILPIFYELSIDEFKQLDCQEGYFHCWKGHNLSTLTEDQVQLWKEAMKTISKSNGIHCHSMQSEVTMIAEIIDTVCKRVVPDLQFEVSDVQGRNRLSGMIQENFQKHDVAVGKLALVSACFVGLYGMGGMGKTLLSKVICNNMRQQFLGKVCHLELGTKDVLGLRKQMIMETTNLDANFVTTKINDERKAMKLLVEHVCKQKIFLVLDNVMDSHEGIREAKSYLKDLPFKVGSIVLVTARSYEALQKLNIEWHICMLIPSLRKEEAMALFIQNTNCDPLFLSEEAKKAFEMGVERCCFDVGDNKVRVYHPLALTVLGSYYGCKPDEWQSIANNLDLKHSINEDIHPIFRILRTSYDALSPKKKRLFLYMAATNDHGIWCADVSSIYAALYAEFNDEWFKLFLKELKAKSLIESYGWGKKIYIHDLYREFAQLEMESNGLSHTKDCVLFGRSNPGHYQERSLLIYDLSSSSCGNVLDHLVAKEMSCKCFQSEIVMVEKCPNLLSASFEGMEHLRVLTIKKCPGLRNIHVDGVKDLTTLHCEDYDGEYPTLKDLWSLGTISIEYKLNAKGGDFSRGLDLSECPNLWQLRLMNHVHLQELPNFFCVQWIRILHISDCHRLEKFTGLEALTSIRIMVLGNCSSLLVFPPLSKFTQMEDFTLDGALLLEELSSFANLVGLQELALTNGKLLKELPGITMCKMLKYLDLNGTDIDDFSWISDMKELQYLSLSDTKFMGLPYWNKLYKLEKLYLQDCLALQSLANVGTLRALQVLATAGSGNLKYFSVFSNFPLLKVLNLNNTSVDDVSGVEYCVCLEYLGVAKTSIASLPDLSNLLKLKTLSVWGCSSLTRLDNTKRLPSLEKFDVYDCTNLVALPDLRHSKNIQGSLGLRNTPFVDPNLVKLPT